MKHVKQLITVALACMLAVPAFAMPMVGDAGRAGMFGQLDLTEEEMANMTLAELKEMVEEAKNDAPDRPLLLGNLGLLVTDLTVEDVEGMTPTEIEALKEKLLEELDSMTLAEIEELKEERKADMEELTLSEMNELREVLNLLGLGGKHNNRPGMTGPNGFQGPQGNLPEMAGFCGRQQGTGMGSMNAPGSDMQGSKL